jgi:raffinose/stachyose/melibiose transport system permease protein
MWFGLILSLTVYVLFGIVPVLGNFVISLTNYSGLAGSSVQFTGVSNYTQMFTTDLPGFLPGLKATLIFVVGVTVVQNVLALMLSHRLIGEGRTTSLLRVLVFLPVVLGVTVVGLAWILIFNPQEGPGASILSLFGTQSAFFGSSSAAMPLVIFVQVWQHVGFSTLVFIGGLRSINPEIYEAAVVDGVNSWQRLRRITLPLLTSSVSVNILLSVVGTFTTYNLIYVLTDGQNGTNTLGMLAFNSAFGTSADLGYGAAVSVALFVLTLATALPLLWWLRRRDRRLLG